VLRGQGTQDDTCNQLTYQSRLAQPFGHLAQGPRGDQKNEKNEKKIHAGVRSPIRGAIMRVFDLRFVAQSGLPLSQRKAAM
jgi:hypothetical protein